MKNLKSIIRRFMEHLSWHVTLLQHGAQSLYLKIWSACWAIMLNKYSTLTTNMKYSRRPMIWIPMKMPAFKGHLTTQLVSGSRSVICRVLGQWTQLMLSFTQHRIQYIDLHFVKRESPTFLAVLRTLTTYHSNTCICSCPSPLCCLGWGVH